MAKAGLKILSFPVGEDGCSGYRVRKPLEGLKRYTDHDIHIIDPHKDNMTEITRQMPSADVIFMRPGSEIGRRQILSIPEMRATIKAKWVMDIDDNLDMVSPYSEFYRHNGLNEFSHNGVKIWEDGKNGFNLDENRIRVKSQKQGLIEADMVTVTTDTLGGFAREFNSNVFVNDNTIDFSEWWRIDHAPNKRLKILWAGSPSHYEDFYSIKDGLNRILNEYDVELIFAGSSYIGLFDRSVMRKITALPWVAFKAHSYRLMSLCADIAVIPLVDDPFNTYKSAIKFYEASAMGIPAVVSNVSPYSEVAKHGNSLLYRNNGGFYKQMKSLIENPDLRSKIGNIAYNWVYENKNLEKQSVKFGEALEKLCLKK